MPLPIPAPAMAGWWRSRGAGRARNGLLAAFLLLPLLAACETTTGSISSDDPVLRQAIFRENVALACREYAIALDAFTSYAESGRAMPTQVEQARVIRNQVGPLCENQETASQAVLPAMRNSIVQLVILGTAR